ncbi:SH3-domain-containing protein, partial [Rhizopus microsporus var. microsporus]
ESNIQAANYILESIIRDLGFLKDNNFLPHQTYQEVVALLPNHISAVDDTVPRPPLPLRKSNSNTTTHQLTPPQPREVSNGPKLPVRRTNDWSPQPIAMPLPVVNARQLEPEKVHTTPPPPAYAEQNNSNVIATAEALYDYHGDDPTTDLSFKQGDIIEVIEYVNDDWWKGTTHGKTGIFPQNHVKKLPPPVKAKRPWTPQPPAKPSNDHLYNNNALANNNYNNNVPSYPATSGAPYAYPPPPTTIYQPPPPAQSYGPPIVAVAHEEEKENKVSNLTKKFGGQVANAATWGFGATLGSKAADAIF